jgi:hypothetical protein
VIGYVDDIIDFTLIQQSTGKFVSVLMLSIFQSYGTALEN